MSFCWVSLINIDGHLEDGSGPKAVNELQGRLEGPVTASVVGVGPPAYLRYQPVEVTQGFRTFVQTLVHAARVKLLDLLLGRPSWTVTF